MSSVAVSFTEKKYRSPQQACQEGGSHKGRITRLASCQLLKHVGFLSRGLHAPLHLLHGLVRRLQAAQAGIQAGEVSGEGQDVCMGVEQQGGGGRRKAASHHG